MNEPKHTPLPWNLHYAYVGKPFLVDGEDSGEPWIAANLVIASGDIIIATVEMCTREKPHCGFDRVRLVEGMRANAKLILAAVNSFYEKEKDEW